MTIVILLFGLLGGAEFGTVIQRAIIYGLYTAAAAYVCMVSVVNRIRQKDLE